MTRALLALGSNLGDRSRFLAAARAGLEAGGARVERATSVIETEPLGVLDQPAFLNQILEVEWGGDAPSLLDLAKRVETQVGRTETYRWGPREIDIDILRFGSESINTPTLTIPHPALETRPFLHQLLSELEG